VAKKRTEKINFESAIKELESLVEQMEQGDITLEQSLENFERGIELSRACQKALQEAEQKVQILTQKQGEDTVEDFHAESADTESSAESNN
jgi:exodeoxyribonuclease VII small subunit